MSRICSGAKLPVAVVTFCAATVGISSGEIIYVKADATGTNDGTSWPDAYVHLQDGLARARAGDQIWVGEGAYRPDQGQDQTPGDRAATFRQSAAIELYGGFAGDEQTLEQRAGLFDDTVLSGDLAENDEPNFVNREENSFHVVFADTDSQTPFVVDGLRIVGGNAMDAPDDKGGGGILVLSGRAELRNCTFADNEGEYGGGVGIGGWDSDRVVAALEVCQFEDNRAVGGGGLSLGGAREAEIEISGCAFRRNVGGWGGGLTIGFYSPPTIVLRDCIFEENTATDEYPMLSGGGAISSGDQFSAVNCTFRSNQAANGGAVYRSGRGDHTVLQGCVFVDNVAKTTEHIACGGAVYFWEGRFTVRDCTFSGNSIEVPPVEHYEAAGGALCCNQVGWGLVIDCTFTDNSSSHDGGAVFNWWCKPWYVNCVFIGNSAHGDDNRFGGGAVFNNQYANARIINSIFVGNSATGTSPWSGGGAVHNALDSWPIIANSTFVANEASSRGGGILTTWDSVARVRNCILWSNTAGAESGERAQIDDEGGDSESRLDYCCVEGWTGALGGAANFGDDPLLVDLLGPDGDPGTGDEDLHLAPGSPCIDRGLNWRVLRDRNDVDGDGDTDERIPFDLDGEGRFFDDPNTPDAACGDTAIVDLGAYEVGGTGPQPCYPDLTGDGSIDLDDVYCLLDSYGLDYTDPGFNPICDLDVDGATGLGDLAELLSHYGATCP